MTLILLRIATLEPMPVDSPVYYAGNASSDESFYSTSLTGSPIENKFLEGFRLLMHWSTSDVEELIYSSLCYSVFSGMKVIAFF